MINANQEKKQPKKQKPKIAIKKDDELKRHKLKYINHLITAE